MSRPIRLHSDVFSIPYFWGERVQVIDYHAYRKLINPFTFSSRSISNVVVFDIGMPTTTQFKFKFRKL